MHIKSLRKPLHCLRLLSSIRALNDAGESFRGVRTKSGGKGQTTRILVSRSAEKLHLFILCAIACQEQSYHRTTRHAPASFKMDFLLSCLLYYF